MEINLNKIKNVFDALLDEKNNDDIVITYEDGKNQVFEQIAIIPLDGKIYPILRPIDKIRTEIEYKNDAVIFCIDETNGNKTLSVVKENEIIKEIISIYNKLCDEEGID